MPRRYARKAKRYRRRTRKSYRKRNLLSFSKAPIPNKFATKLRYQEAISVNPGAAGAAAVHVFSANGCYDPNVTGTGHQPRGFDQFMAMYDHFTVIGAKITANFIEGANNDTYCWVALKDSNSTSIDPNDYLEARNVVSTILPWSGTGGNNAIRTLSKKSSTRKFLGRSHPMSDPELKGSAGSNPTEQLYFHIGIAPVDSSVDEGSHFINVRIDYLVVFTEPKQPTQS